MEANITNAAWGNAAIQGRRGTGSGASTYLFGTPTAISGIATTGTSAAGVQGTSDAGIGVAGFSTNGTGVSGINMNSGSAGVFRNGEILPIQLRLLMSITFQPLPMLMVLGQQSAILHRVVFLRLCVVSTMVQAV